MSAIFDAAVFDAFKADYGEEDSYEALATFFADAAERLQRLDALDRARVRLEAHSLKSSAAMFGFMALSRLARELEPQAATLEAEGLRQGVEELRRAFEAAQKVGREKLTAGAMQG